MTFRPVALCATGLWALCAPPGMVALAQAPGTGGSGGGLWKWLFIGLLGALILRMILRTIARIKDSDLPASAPLERPTLRLGPRTPQGVLIASDIPQDHQVVHWDTGPVMRWIDAERAAIRDQVKDRDLRQLCDDRTVQWSIKTRAPQLAAAFRVEAALLKDPLEVTGKNPDLYYVELSAARAGFPGAGFAVAHMAWTARGVTDHKIITALFRLDADLDYQPALINLIGYCKQYKIGDQPPFPWDVREAYLRHHFDIGAPGGHSELAEALAVFYMWEATNRPDDGYVAAAMRRLQGYGAFLCKEISERADRWPDNWDLSDNSVSTDGWMLDSIRAQEQTLQ